MEDFALGGGDDSGWLAVCLKAFVIWLQPSRLLT